LVLPEVGNPFWNGEGGACVRSGVGGVNGEGGACVRSGVGGVNGGASAVGEDDFVVGTVGLLLGGLVILQDVSLKQLPVTLFDKLNEYR